LPHALFEWSFHIGVPPCIERNSTLLRIQDTIFEKFTIYFDSLCQKSNGYFFEKAIMTQIISEIPITARHFGASSRAFDLPV
jgi:hypothetical protein